MFGMDTASGAPDDATRVITVRLPKWLHESLKQEAGNARTSLNQFCVEACRHAIKARRAENEPA